MFEIYAQLIGSPLAVISPEGKVISRRADPSTSCAKKLLLLDDVRRHVRMMMKCRMMMLFRMLMSVTKMM